jgi:hypothetical protein
MLANIEKYMCILPDIANPSDPSVVGVTNLSWTKGLGVSIKVLRTSALLVLQNLTAADDETSKLGAVLTRQNNEKVNRTNEI